MSAYTPIVDAILAAMPEIVVPDGMTAGLKFTSPTQTTHGGYEWPNPGEWAECGDGTGTQISAPRAVSTLPPPSPPHSRVATGTRMPCLSPGTLNEAVTDPTEPGKVKAPRILSLARIDMLDLIRKGALSGATWADLSGADLSGATGDLTEGGPVRGGPVRGGPDRGVPVPGRT